LNGDAASRMLQEFIINYP